MKLWAKKEEKLDIICQCMAKVISQSIKVRKDTQEEGMNMYKEACAVCGETSGYSCKCCDCLGAKMREVTQELFQCEGCSRVYTLRQIKENGKDKM